MIKLTIQTHEPTTTPTLPSSPTMLGKRSWCATNADQPFELPPAKQSKTTIAPPSAPSIVKHRPPKRRGDDSPCENAIQPLPKRMKIEIAGWNHLSIDTIESRASLQNLRGKLAADRGKLVILERVHMSRWTPIIDITATTNCSFACPVCRKTRQKMYAVTTIPLFKRVKIETALDISSVIEEETLLVETGATSALEPIESELEVTPPIDLDVSSVIEEDTLLVVEAVLLVGNSIPPLEPIQSDCGSFYSSCGFTGRTLRRSARLQRDKKPVGFYKD